MKYRVNMTYVPATWTNDPEQDESHKAQRKIVEVEATDVDHAKQQAAFELEEQGFRILTIEGSLVE